MSVSAELKRRVAALSDEQRRLLAHRLSAGARPAPVAAGIPRAPRGTADAVFPLSFAQQRIWFLAQIAQFNAVFNVAEGSRLSGRLDLPTLERALAEIVRRHEVLRTVFSTLDGQPVQRVLPSVDVRITVEDLRGIPEADRMPTLTKQAQAELAHSWPLETGPLIRAKVWKFADEDHFLGIFFHHIAADGWSKNVLVRELTTLYEAFSRGESSPLPELGIQYSDFAVWQRDWVAGVECQSQIAFWKKQMAEAPVLQLPSTRIDSSVPMPSGFHRWALIPADLTSGLKTLSQRENATLFMTLLAVFATMLNRYGGQNDIVIGSPVANRIRTEIENLIGCFINPLPLRVDLSGDPTFRELLRRVRDVALGAFANQAVPFDLIVRAVQPKRDAGATPLFQAMFLLQNFNWHGLSMSDASLGSRPLELSEGQASEVDGSEVPGDLAYPVGLEAMEIGDRLVAGFEYAPEYSRLFAGAPGHLRTMVAAIVANPDLRLSNVPLVTGQERQILLHDWNEARRREYAIQPVHRLFEAEAERVPAALAVSCGNERVTYSELNSRANRLARALAARGVGPEVPVGIVMERSLDAVVAVLATLKAGGVYVPLDPNYPSGRQILTVQDAQPRVMVSTTALVAKFADLFSAANGASLLTIDTDEIAGYDDANLTSAAGIQNLAYIVYTSGSTGTPKGTMISHASLANAFFGWKDAYGLGADVHVHLQMASMSFDVFSGDFVRALCSGGTLVLVPQEKLFNPADLYRLMRDEHVDCAEFVPAVLRDLVRHVDETGQSLDFMRVLIAGSDTWFVGEYSDLRKRCGSGTRVVNSYGVSEATIDSSWFDDDVRGEPQDAPLSIGSAFPNTELYVLDAHLQLAPIGVPGELCIGGPNLARGYLNRPDLTAERFIPHPFSNVPGSRVYRTGDRARLGPNGRVELLGRIDNQVKLRGFRIELGEIEAVLAAHDQVAEAAVILREDVPGDKRLVAYTTPAPGGSISAGELRRYLRDKLPEYMVPSAIVELAALPLSPNGKIDRRALPAPDRDRQLEHACVPPSTDVERRIAELWKELLRVETVGIHDNFFDLGGHSLLVIQLHGRLQQQFGPHLSVVDLFTFPTIQSLASRLAERRMPEDTALNAVRERAVKQRAAMARRRVIVERAEVSR